MARISLVDQTLIVDSHNPVKDPDLLRAIASLTETPSDLDFKGELQLLFIPIKIVVGAKRSKVIAMNNNGDITTWVVENTGITLASQEPETFKHLRVGILPKFAGISRSVDASDLSSDSVWWKSELFGNSHEDSSFGQSVEVRFPDVDKRDAERLLLASTFADITGKEHPFALQWRSRS
jgi:hypothetical protein